MLKQKRLVALLLSLVLVVSVFMGNTNFSSVTQVFAAEVNAPSNLSLEEVNSGFRIQWDSYNGANSYDVYRAESRYSNYEKVTTVSGTSWTDTNPNSVKYENYYKVAVAGSNSLSDPISLEMEMFGDGMYVFSPKDDINQVYNAVNDIYKIQGAVDANGNATDGGQFSEGRYALAFKPGDYTNIPADMFNMSYYMQLLGLGELPTDVTLKNVHVPPVLPSANVTCNFWMGIENLSISKNTNGSNDAWYAFNWSVSQAAPARRLYVERTMNLNYLWEGWASGGYVADSIIDGAVGSWSQQQYYLRNNQINGDFYGINWNLVMQGVTGVNGDNWNNTTSKYPMYNLESGLGQTNWKSGGKYTVLDKTDAVREKPFLYYDTNAKEYKVFAPAMRKNAKGVSWSAYGNGSGTTYDISDFYIARADRDNAASINAALDAGKNIILSPGIYYAEEPIKIKRANTIVLGLGLATIIPDNKETGIKIADVDGVTLAGVIVDADSYSKNMVVVGDEGSTVDHSANPTIIQDVFVRVGGVHGGVASTEDALVINSNDVIGDHFWIWRADHGAGVGWNLNTANNGVVVNGDDVTLYGLMVEHFQKFDVLWRGENGKTYFLQNEKAYDPQNQADWMSHNGTVKGYSSYKVANSVDNHYAVGLGMYDVFINTNGASIFLDNAVEVPNKPGVMIENACTVEIANGEGPIVGINSIVNGTGAGITTGAGSGGGYGRQACLVYNNGVGKSIPNYYLTGGNDNFSNTIIEENGITPTDDPDADKTITPSVPTTQEPTTTKQSVATGAYADWKNNAITSPAKGQLVAAGTYDIEFKRLYGATQYEVYVNNKLIKTISGADAQATSFEVEDYSVDVAKHTVKIVATMPQGSKITSNIRTYYVSKKGMGIWQDDAHIIDDTNLSWYYTWNTDPLTGVNENVEFVPMVWGRFDSSQGTYWWLANGAYKDYNYLLTYNEPDRDDQANMSVDEAIRLWPSIAKAQEAGVKISSPATSSPSVLFTDTNNEYGTVGGWTGAFNKKMVEMNYHDDYTAIHFYFDYPAETFVLDTIKKVYEETGKPIWITEWGVAQWSQIQSFNWVGGADNWQRNLITDFLYSILPKIDNLDYVERYAWFPFDGSDTSDFGNGAGGIFFDGANDSKNGQLTKVGKAYAELGIPTGYNADNPTQDEVVDDGNVETPPIETTTEDPYLGYTDCINDADQLVGAWGYYVGQSWTNATAKYKDGADLNNFSMKIVSNDTMQAWGMSAFTVPIAVEAGKEYTVSVTLNSSNATTGNVTFKEDVSGLDIQSKALVAGDNVFTGTFTAATNNVEFIFDLGSVPAGTTLTVNSFSLDKKADVTTAAPTTPAPTTKAPTTAAPTTVAPTTVPVEKVNIITGKVASASTELGGNRAANAVDGNSGSRWESIHDATGNQWLQVDLAGTYSVNGFKITWETAAAKEYDFQVSMDGTNWTTVKSITDGSNGESREETFAATQAKYVRVLCKSKTTGYGYSIWEMEVYGTLVSAQQTTAAPTTATPTTPAPTTAKPTTAAPTTTVAPTTQAPTIPANAVNVASGKVATASTELGGNLAANAIDGNNGSRWETIQDAPNPQWIQIDLAGTYNVSAFRITWETAAAKEYKFQVSMDGTNWTTVSTVTNGKNGESREEIFATTQAKYVRVLCESKTTGYGYSIWEMEVLGTLVSAQQTTAAPTTAAPTTAAPTTQAPTTQAPTTQAPTVANAVNISDGKTATASTELGGNLAANAIDGNNGSRWETLQDAPNPQWIQIDLAGTYNVSKFSITWETAAAKEYKFQVSMDGTNWATVKTITDGTSGQTREETFAATQAKYVRVLCESKTTQYGYSIWEMDVYGTAASAQVTTQAPTTQAPTTAAPTTAAPTTPAVKSNVVLNKAASTSDVYGNNEAKLAVDGNNGSRWETSHGQGGTAWLQVDLGGTYTVDSFKINWEGAAAKEYQFQVSMDGTNWTTVKAVTDGKSGETREESFAATQAKYVRLNCTTKTTGYGYSIWEMEVYGW